MNMNASHSLTISNIETFGQDWPQHQQTEATMMASDNSGVHIGFIRILVPVNADEDSRWGIRYALRQRHLGNQVEVILLHIGEPITQWQVLRFRTQQEIAQFQSKRAQAFIEDAAKPLTAESIPYRGFFKQGEVAFAILDAAEELDCHEIAMPLCKTVFWGIFSRDILYKVTNRQRNIPVIAVRSDGIPGDIQGI